MSVVVVTAFPVPGHRAEVVVALADLRSALQGKLSSGLDAQVSCRTGRERAQGRAVTAPR
jgi:hypothetical protein